MKILKENVDLETFFKKVSQGSLLMLDTEIFYWDRFINLQSP